MALLHLDEAGKLRLKDDLLSDMPAPHLAPELDDLLMEEEEEEEDDDMEEEDEEEEEEEDN